MLDDKVSERQGREEKCETSTGNTQKRSEEGISRRKGKKLNNKRKKEKASKRER